jgi:sigma-E factor negative regulatory protein RseA
MDGEVSPEQLDAALAGALHAEGRDSWELYHRIGDVLRSADLDVPMSNDFAARMSARLAAEPAIVAPVHAIRVRRLQARRLVLPGALAAAAAAVAFVATPQLLVAMQGGSDHAKVVASTPVPEIAPAPVRQAASTMHTQDIDEYLIAHQRFSPSVYSSTQYARPAAFTSGATNK